VLRKFANIKIENIFLFTAIIIGLIFTFVSPPLSGPDEVVHFTRAYQISEFKIYEEKNQNEIGGYIPVSLQYVINELKKEPIILVQHNKSNKVQISNITSLFKVPLNKEVKTFMAFPSTAAYFPIMYLFESLGIGIAKVFNLTPLALFYFGRIFNLIGWAILTYFSIKLIPIGRKVMFLLGLSPMILFQAATLSPDAITNGVAFLLISVFLRYAFDDKLNIGIKEVLVLILLSSTLALCKQAYFLISILFLIIPVKKASSKRKYFSIFASIILTNIVLILLWSYSVRYAIVPLRPNVSTYDQLVYIFENPLRYCKLIIKTFLSNRHLFLEEWVGRLGWLDIFYLK